MIQLLKYYMRFLFHCVLNRHTLEIYMVSCYSLMKLYSHIMHQLLSPRFLLWRNTLAVKSAACFYKYQVGLGCNAHIRSSYGFSSGTCAGPTVIASGIREELGVLWYSFCSSQIDILWLYQLQCCVCASRYCLFHSFPGCQSCTSLAGYIYMAANFCNVLLTSYTIFYALCFEIWFL